MKNPSIIFLSFLLFLFSCAPKQTIESAIELPADARTDYLTPVDYEDLSYSNIKRTQVRAMVPRGLDSTQVLNNIKSLVCDAYNKSEPDRISVLLYKIGDDMKSSYTVAMGEYAPNGEWGAEIKTDDLSIYELKVSYAKGYFLPEKKINNIGETVVVHEDKKWDRDKREFVKANSVEMYNSVKEWTENTLLAKIPNNSEVVILDINKQDLIDGEVSIMYKVKYKNYSGWIFYENVKQ